MRKLAPTVTPRLLDAAGTRLLDALEFSCLTMLNLTSLCKGEFTRVEVKANKTETSTVEYVVCSESVLPFVKSLTIHESTPKLEPATRMLVEQRRLCEVIMRDVMADPRSTEQVKELARVRYQGARTAAARACTAARDLTELDDELVLCQPSEGACNTRK
jgi:hypothetical protein